MLMINQNLAVHVYYMFYLHTLSEKYNYCYAPDSYKDIAFDVNQYDDNLSNDFRVVQPTSSVQLTFTIKINNKIIDLNARISTVYIKGRWIPAIRISMCEYCDEVITYTDDALDEMEDRLDHWIKLWKKDHSAEFKYWEFCRPSLNVVSFKVSRFIPMHALNKKTISSSIKYIDDVLNTVIKTYIDLNGGNDNVK